MAVPYSFEAGYTIPNFKSNIKFYCMKNSLLLLFTALLFTSAAFAQQEKRSEYMTVTILSNMFYSDHILYIVTKEDQAQEEDTLLYKALKPSRNKMAMGINDTDPVGHIAVL